MKNIAIIGAGIGGLVAALQLHQHGYDVTVYEATSTIEALGVGINLQPNAVEVLAKLDLLDALMSVGVTPKTMAYYSQCGTLIFQEERGQAADYAYPQISIHRGKLQQVLYRAFCERLGTERICFDHALQDLTERKDHVTLHFGSNRSAQADMVIGADGIGSTVRKCLHSHEGILHFEGIRMWRGTTTMPTLLDGKTVLVCGTPEVQLVLYPLSHPDEHGMCMLNWVVEILDPEATTLHADLWNNQSDRHAFDHHFAAWHLPFIDLDTLFGEATLPILEYPMVDRNPLSSWGTQRITLLGDAAHPMYPRGGNGATQAIIDAHAVAQDLDSGNTIAESLQHYENTRRPATAKIVLNNRESNQTKFFAWFETEGKHGATPPEWFSQKAKQYHRDAGLQ